MTSQPGIGAMLHYLGGGSKEDPKSFYGRTITKAEMKDDKILLAFDDGQKIAVFDDGQSCCESRYMTTDDDMQSLVGHTLTRIEAKEGPSEDGEYGECHEQVFLEIGTDKSFITVANHNKHNGYYGGFGLTVTKQ